MQLRSLRVMYVDTCSVFQSIVLCEGAATHAPATASGRAKTVQVYLGYITGGFE